MGHNLHGDIPAEDLELAEELLEMEAFFDAHLNVYPPDLVARVMCCLAHDWYEVGDDDKGSDLLEKANKVCPGYFDNQIKLHIEQDLEFARLVESLTNNILAIARSIVDK